VQTAKLQRRRATRPWTQGSGSTTERFAAPHTANRRVNENRTAGCLVVVG
jgi:hypothetical protein